MSRRRSVLRALRSRLYGPFDCDTDIIALHDYRLLYLAVPKVANSSVKALLAPHVPVVRERVAAGAAEDGFSTPFSDPAVRRELERQRILVCKHELGRFRGYASIALVRNPWDRLVSCYVQKIEGRNLDRDPESRGTTRALVKAGVFKPQMTFPDFVRAVAAVGDLAANRHFRSQAAFLCDNRQRLIPRTVVRFESMAADLPGAFAGAGLEVGELPHFKSTGRRDYRTWYDEETAAIVAQRYQRDVELFGYTFDGGAA